MTILSDSTISDYAYHNGMIYPFIGHQVKTDSTNPSKRLLSYGLSSAGYDVRLTGDVKIFTNVNTNIIDPKKFDDKCLVSATIHDSEDGKYFVIPPNSYALGVTVEYFNLPRNVMAVVLGKSTLARCGISINCTMIEPGFMGHVVIEIANTTHLPTKIYIGEGIAQFVFHELDRACVLSYADRGGKYMHQTNGITLAKV